MMESLYEKLKATDERNWMVTFRNMKAKKKWPSRISDPRYLLRELDDDSSSNTSIVSRIINLYVLWLKKTHYSWRGVGDTEKLFPSDGLLFSQAKMMFHAYIERDANLTAALVSQGLIQVVPDSDETLAFVKLMIQWFWTYDFHSDVAYYCENREYDEEYERILRARLSEEIDFPAFKKKKQKFAKRFVNYIEETSKFNPTYFRRIIFLTKILRAMLFFSLKDCRPPSLDLAEEHVKCLRLYFRAIPDTFVTEGELRNFLMLFKNVVVERCHLRWVNLMVENYDQLFHPESRLPSAPRSLEHLCRCAVRNSLVDNKSEPLPVLVEKLHVPQRLKGLLINGVDYMQTV